MEAARDYISESLNPKRNLDMSAPVSKREKQGERKKRKR